MSSFESAADAIVNGDTALLESLLRQDPALVHARSGRPHHVALLHYVSANGVEQDRQKTPNNIVRIAEMLLQAGADIHATADLYGSPSTTLDLAATSGHPERAGVQEALLQTLLQHGARIGPFLVNSCLSNGRGKAAMFLAGRIADRGAPLNFAAAAGLGRVTKDEISAATQEQCNEGFFYACEYGRNDVVAQLIRKPVDLGAQDANGQTGLHRAVIGGHLDTVSLLLTHNAPLEIENAYGGTVLGQALWSAENGGDPNLYPVIIRTLIAAGARLPEHDSKSEFPL